MSREAADASTLAQLWTAELLTGLDWRRLVELARALAAAAGFLIGKTKVFPSGAAEFVMYHQTSNGEQRTLLRLTSWNRWMAHTECLTEFVEALPKVSPGAHGIYLAPGGFSDSAAHLARHHGIEMVDAEALARRLNDLPREHGEFFHEIGIAGDARTPSCPICLQRMKLTEPQVESAADFDGLPDLSFHGHEIVGDTVRARRVEVLPHSEVQFLHAVRARDVVVHGIARGDFYCDGGLLLNPGAILYGSVSARSVLVRPGAELLGVTTILDSTPKLSAKKLPGKWWRCQNAHPRPGCSAVSFAPHE